MIRTVLAILVFVTALQAQPKAQLSGFVRDASNAAADEVAIGLLNLDTGIRRSTQTNNEGFYAVSSLTPGQYRLTIRKPGFTTIARTGLTLHAMDATRMDFTLEIGSVREEITVEGTPSLMNTTDASYGMNATRNPAEQLPVNGRGLQGLIDLAPGVLTTPATAGEAGQFSANGQRPATNYFTVDGVSANNGVSGAGLPGQFSGGALPAMTAIGSLHNLVSLGELDELRVQTSTFAPEYGRLPGAQVAVSTRSGSNEFHGDVFLSLRNEKANANDWFANAGGLGRAKQRFTDTGGTFGGPILRNRTFFLFSTEHIRLRQPTTVLIPLPSLNARETAPAFTRPILNAFPLPNGPNLTRDVALHTAQVVNPSSVDATSVRIDQGLGASGSLFGRWNRTPSSNRFGYLQGTENGFVSQTVTLGLVSVVASRFTNDVRTGFSRTNVDSRWLPGAARIDLRSILPSPGDGQRLYAVAIRGLGQIITGDPGASRQSQWTLTDTLSFTSGRHDIRVGFDYQRLTPERDKPIDSVTQVFDSFDRLLLGAIPTYNFAQTGAGRSLLETLSAFAQDTWHATPRLNLTWGVRWEFTPAPVYQSKPLWGTRYTQFAPRFGAAYRLNDRTVIRAGAGLFYDLGFSSAVDIVNGAPYNRFRSTVGLANIAVNSIEYGFASNLKLPYTAQWNVAIERGFGSDSALSAAWVGSAGRGLMRREGTASKVLATNNGSSDYNSLQLHYRSRNVRGVQGTVSWTWAHAIDNGSWDSATWLIYPGSTDRGNANFDVRHSFQAALAYDLGRTRLRWSRGWLISGAFRARTGFPVDIITSDQPFGLGFDNDQRPDWIGGQFVHPPPGRQGTLGRNAIAGHGLAQLDMALQRDVVLSERARAVFRVEAYNLTNTPHFGDPVRIMSSPLFGRPVSMMNLMLGAGRPDSGLSSAFQSGGPRVLQMGVTVRF